MTAPVLIVFAHGARDPAWAQPLDHICAALRSNGLRVEQAFLELQEPRIGPVLAQLANEGVTDIAILPVFVARGSHLRRDLPELIAQACCQHPELQVRTLPPLGEMDEVIRAITWHTLRSIGFLPPGD